MAKRPCFVTAGTRPSFATTSDLAKCYERRTLLRAPNANGRRPVPCQPAKREPPWVLRRPQTRTAPSCASGRSRLPGQESILASTRAAECTHAPTTRLACIRARSMRLVCTIAPIHRPEITRARIVRPEITRARIVRPEITRAQIVRLATIRGPTDPINPACARRNAHTALEFSRRSAHTALEFSQRNAHTVLEFNRRSVHTALVFVPQSRGDRDFMKIPTRRDGRQHRFSLVRQPVGTCASNRRLTRHRLPRWARNV